MEIEPGFYPDMPFEKYLAIEALSNSGLKKFKTPAHYKAPAKPISSQQQTAFDIGTAFHTATLEPEKYDDQIIVTSKSTVTAGEKKEAAQEGKIILKQPAHENVQGMAGAVRKHPDAGPLVQGGVTELSCFWKDPDFDFLCKLRTDKITDSRVVVDLKSTGDAEDESRGFGSFWKNFFSLWYHWQAYWYLNGLSIASGVPHDDFAFIAVEKDPPYGINVYFADKELLAWAMEEIEPVKLRYAECLEKDEWPCYETGYKWIGKPAWAKQRQEY